MSYCPFNTNRACGAQCKLFSNGTCVFEDIKSNLGRINTSLVDVTTIAKLIYSLNNKISAMSAEKQYSSQPFKKKKPL